MEKPSASVIAQTITQNLSVIEIGVPGDPLA